jgi:prepilin-type N-terminal cleavage/methylation domain-containing protein
MTALALTGGGDGRSARSMLAIGRARLGRSRGFTLLELLATVAIASLAAGLAVDAGSAWKHLAGLEGARLTTVLALLEARRRAYLTEATAELAAEPGTKELVVTAAGLTPVRLALPAEAVVREISRSGRIRFFASGLAENATIRLGSGTSDDAVAVVVNQRGEVR